MQISQLSCSLRIVVLIRNFIFFHRNAKLNRWWCYHRFVMYRGCHGLLKMDR